jgi:hypothetical protein
MAAALSQYLNHPATASSATLRTWRRLSGFLCGRDLHRRPLLRPRSRRAMSRTTDISRYRPAAARSITWGGDRGHVKPSARRRKKKIGPGHNYVQNMLDEEPQPHIKTAGTGPPCLQRPLDRSVPSIRTGHASDTYRRVAAQVMAVLGGIQNVPDTRGQQQAWDCRPHHHN